MERAMRSVPLRDLHKELGASMGVFAGWVVPMVYQGVLSEHMVVREASGMFDVSHMGKIMVRGKGATELLDRLVAKEIKHSRPGLMLGPTAFLNHDAGFKDDVMLYRLGRDVWLVVCNAVNTFKVFKWLEDWANELSLDVELSELTEDHAMFALQGPTSGRVLAKAGAAQLLKLRWMEFVTDVSIAGTRAFLVSRSGWTGEDGFEILVALSEAERIYKRLVEAGAVPAGMIARDSLRVEMGYHLYGNEIDESITPVEARYWVFTPEKTGYVGWEALRRALIRGVDRFLMGIKLSAGARVVPRKGYGVYVDHGTKVGEVTSGAFTPVLNRGVALAYIDARHAAPGMRVLIEVRGKMYMGKVVNPPFIGRDRG